MFFTASSIIRLPFRSIVFTVEKKLGPGVEDSNQTFLDLMELATFHDIKYGFWGITIFKFRCRYFFPYFLNAAMN